MLIILIVVVLIGLGITIEWLWIKYNGRPVLPPIIPRQPQTIGTGQPLSYVILGDSTAISQGGDYIQGYAAATAHYLAKKHRVTWVNLAISGARSQDVAVKQLPQAITHRPDVVLVVAGANDVTHLTGMKSVYASLLTVLTELRRANPAVRIILTGSPDMGSVPRLPQPLRWIAGVRTKILNKMVARLASTQGVTFAPIARETGPVFRARHELFAADNFHATTEGYLIWVPVLTRALDEASPS